MTDWNKRKKEIICILMIVFSNKENGRERGIKIYCKNIKKDV